MAAQCKQPSREFCYLAPPSDGSLSGERSRNTVHAGVGCLRVCRRCADEISPKGDRAPGSPPNGRARPEIDPHAPRPEKECPIKERCKSALGLATSSGRTQWRGRNRQPEKANTLLHLFLARSCYTALHIHFVVIVV